MIVIILSNQQFDSKLKTNKWQVANQMAKKGHYVIFVDPPLRFKALKNITKMIDYKKDNLVVYKPINLLNFKPFSALNTFVHLNVINNLVNKFKQHNEKKILYIYHFDFPDLRDFFKSFKHDVSVYDCVDIYSEFPEYAIGVKVNPSFVSFIQKIDDYFKVKFNQNGLNLKSWVDAQEEWLCKNVDLVFASAPGIVSHLNKWRKNVEYLPNAVDFEKFDHAVKDQEPNDIKNIPHPRIGFSGAIDSYKNNIKLIEKCAQTYPNYHFIMIGPEKVSDPNLDLSVLKSLSNVHFLGEKPWEQTPSYFDHFDAYFIPYNLNDYTRGCHPIKYFEGLASGLPTLITLSSVKAFDPDNYVTEDEEQFIKNIEIAVTTDSSEKRKARKDLARQHTWSGKVDKQIGFITKKLIV
jgi:hypothetical protein